MNYIGISCGFHDAALAVVGDRGEILFAAHSERYSREKNDRQLHRDLINNAYEYIDGNWQLHYYERPVLKYLRQLRAGQGPSLGSLFASNVITEPKLLMLGNKPIQTHGHHRSHAAAGFQTSPFDRATVVVIDAIGEFDTITIWGAEYRSDRAYYKLLWRQTYPDSIGLFYSAMTAHVGLKPNEDEYILMGMSAYGRTSTEQEIANYAVQDYENLTFKQNFHCRIDKRFMGNDYDIASGTQAVTEHLITSVMTRARAFNWSTNLVYGGGVALNCLANRNLGDFFENIWIMPNPGDGGSSLGAAALGYGGRLRWTSAYLGYLIPGSYPVASAVDRLCTHGMVGVASGRAEWGPRALGNRSLLADPRGSHVKDQVNRIKQRQQFRPFAPVILEEYVEEYFDMPKNWPTSRYMQTTAVCRYPERFPAICHVDGTSRVQTVSADGSGIRQLLEAWYSKTGCPMLLNTSLNIKGQPMVNTVDDARDFEQTYGLPVLVGE
jgi:carbamoyltransferase